MAHHISCGLRPLKHVVYVFKGVAYTKLPHFPLNTLGVFWDPRGMQRLGPAVIPIIPLPDDSCMYPITREFDVGYPAPKERVQQGPEERWGYLVVYGPSNMWYTVSYLWG